MARTKPAEPTGRHAVTDRHRTVARQYFREGKSLEKAMSDNGFAAAYGRKGIRNIKSESKPFHAAFNEEFEKYAKEADASEMPIPMMEKMVMHRLVENVVRGDDKACRSAELLGRTKKLDLFVRTGDPQVGIFAVLNDPESAKILDELAAALSDEQTSPKVIGTICGEPKPSNGNDTD